MKAKPILLLCLVTLSLLCSAATEKEWKPPLNDKDKRVINKSTYRELTEIELRVALKKYEQTLELIADLEMQKAQIDGAVPTKETDPLRLKIVGLWAYTKTLTLRIIELRQKLSNPPPEPAPAAGPAPAPSKTAPADATPPGKTP